MNPSSDESEFWRLGPLPEPVSWAVGIVLVLLFVALVLQVALEVIRDRAHITWCRPSELLDELEDKP